MKKIEVKFSVHWQNTRKGVGTYGNLRGNMTMLSERFLRLPEWCLFLISSSSIPATLAVENIPYHVACSN